MLHPRRFVWLLGLLLLVGTAAGAGWVLNHGEGEGKPAPRGADVDTPPASGAIGIGYVDVEPGVANLYPLQSGRVTWVKPEASAVKKGEVLLTLDDAAQQADLRRAEAALRAAQEQLARAELLPKQREDELAQLRAAVEAVKGERAAAQAQLALTRRAVKNQTTPAEQEQAAQAVVQKVGALVKAAQAKLKSAEDAPPPEREIARAKADVAEKEALVSKAKVAVRECKVLAPEDGDVLRVLTAAAETLGPSPKQPALQFCPKLPRIVRAEVRQEWAARVKVGQDAVIEDDSATGLRWPGRVKRVSDWYTHRRSVVQEPFQFNDVRTLECLVEVTGSGPEPLRIGQRMRVIFR